MAGPSEKAVNRQNDHRSDNGADEPCAFASTILSQRLAEPCGNEGANNAEDRRPDEA